MADSKVEVLPTRVGVDRLGVFLMCLCNVLPTRVGVDRRPSTALPLSVGSPHTRGGGPPSTSRPRAAWSFSPHAWGWTVLRDAFAQRVIVLPTRVGVDRCIFSKKVRACRSPHTRGGGPRPVDLLLFSEAFSPHAWGWTSSSRMRACTSFSPHAWGWTATEPVHR